MNLWQALAGFRAPLATAFVAFITVVAVTPWVIQFAKNKGAMDDPKRDDRRVHTEPIPRWGGLAVFPGFLAAVLVSLSFAWPRGSFPMYLVGMIVCSAGLLVMGMLDDVKQLSAKVPTALPVGGRCHRATVRRRARPSSNPRSDSSGSRLDAFCLVDFGSPNCHLHLRRDQNDGHDRRRRRPCERHSRHRGGTIVTLAVFGQQRWVALSAAAVGGACIGFLRYNYNPARIFLAGGAQVIGFLLACLSVVGALKTAATLSILLPMLLFSVPFSTPFSSSSDASAIASLSPRPTNAMSTTLCSARGFRSGRRCGSCISSRWR